MIGQLILRLSIWFLLTADLSLPNIVIGVAIAFLLPRSFTSREVLKEWLHVLGEAMVAIPTAFIEAFEIILRPHNHEEVKMVQAKPRRTPGLVFLDIFLITFTPKTIVVKHHEEGWYEVHQLRRRKKR